MLIKIYLAAPWIWDSKELELDLFDCRSTEWLVIIYKVPMNLLFRFIDAATMSKNVLIMLDLSGSMLGQRLEIAKQTVESILGFLEIIKE